MRNPPKTGDGDDDWNQHQGRDPYDLQHHADVAEWSAKLEIRLRWSCQWHTRKSYGASGQVHGKELLYGEAAGRGVRQDLVGADLRFGFRKPL